MEALEQAGQLSGGIPDLTPLGVVFRRRALIRATATLPLRNPQSGSARLAGSLPPPGTTLVSGTGRPVVAPLPDSTPV